MNKTAEIKKVWCEDAWIWSVELYKNGQLDECRTFDYYTGIGSQAAIDCAREWDRNFVVWVKK